MQDSSNLLGRDLLRVLATKKDEEQEGNAKYLFEQNINPKTPPGFKLPFTVTDENQNSLLHFAAANGYKNFIQALATESPEIMEQLINGKNNQDMTPLHLACSSGHPEIVDLFLSLGAKVTSESDKIDEPLLLLLKAPEKMTEPHLQVIKSLLKHSTGMDVGKLKYLKAVFESLCEQFQKNNLSEETGLSGEVIVIGSSLTNHPLGRDLFRVLATKKDEEQEGNVKYLFEQNINPKTPPGLKLPLTVTDENQNSLLHFAAANGYKNFIQILAAESPKRMKQLINGKNNQDMTPLHLACSSGHPEIVDLLLSLEGAKVTTKSDKIDEPLLLLLKTPEKMTEPHLQVIKSLLKHNAGMGIGNLKDLFESLYEQLHRNNLSVETGLFGEAIVIGSGLTKGHKGFELAICHPNDFEMSLEDIEKPEDYLSQGNYLEKLLSLANKRVGYSENQAKIEILEFIEKLDLMSPGSLKRLCLRNATHFIETDSNFNEKFGKAEIPNELRQEILEGSRMLKNSERLLLIEKTLNKLLALQKELNDSAQIANALSRTKILHYGGRVTVISFSLLLLLADIIGSMFLMNKRLDVPGHYYVDDKNKTIWQPDSTSQPFFIPGMLLFALVVIAIPSLVASHKRIRNWLEFDPNSLSFPVDKLENKYLHQKSALQTMLTQLVQQELLPDGSVVAFIAAKEFSELKKAMAQLITDCEDKKKDLIANTGNFLYSKKVTFLNGPASFEEKRKEQQAHSSILLPENDESEEDQDAETAPFI